MYPHTRRHANRAPCTIRQSADVADTTEKRERRETREANRETCWREMEANSEDDVIVKEKAFVGKHL